MKALTALSGADARQLAQRLTAQDLLVAQHETVDLFGLAEHLHTPFLPTASSQGKIGAENFLSGTEPVAAGTTEQVAPGQSALDQSLDRLTDVQWRIVGHADVPRSLAELMAHTSYRQRPHFAATYLEPLLTGGLLRQTIPDKPRSSRQRYVLTEVGVQLKQLREQQQVAGPTEDNDGH